MSTIFETAYEGAQKSALSLADVRAMIADASKSAGEAGESVVDFVKANQGNIGRGLAGAAGGAALYGMSAARRPYETEEEFKRRRVGGSVRSGLLGGAIAGLAVPAYNFATQTIPEELAEANQKLIDEREANTRGGPEIIADAANENADTVGKVVGGVAGGGVGYGSGYGATKLLTSGLDKIDDPSGRLAASAEKLNEATYQSRKTPTPRNLRRLSDVRAAHKGLRTRLQGRPALAKMLRIGGGAGLALPLGLAGSGIGGHIGEGIKNEHYNQ